MNIADNQSSRTMRLDFVDKLRVALTMLVIAHHSAQPYGPTGGAWPVSNAERSPILLPFFAVNAAFFMGLFFLLSGYFVPGSYDRKGAAAFMKGRLIRLGIPTVIFAFLIFGPINYFSLEPRLSFTKYAAYLYDHGWTPFYGHLWFLLHLLLYGLIYIGLRKIGSGIKTPSGVSGGLIRHRHILAYVVLLAIVTWIVRIWYPVDRWVPLFFLIPSEIAHLPQYFSLFMIGILAYRHDWLRNIPARLGWTWFGIGLAASGTFYFYQLVYLQYSPKIAATGGLSWQSFVWCIWEAFICGGFCVGFPVVFRELLNSSPGRLVKALIVSAYGAYVIHVVIVVGIQMSLNSASLPPLVKFAIVTVLGITSAFGISWLLRFIPGVTKVL